MTDKQGHNDSRNNESTKRDKTLSIRTRENHVGNNDNKPPLTIMISNTKVAKERKECKFYKRGQGVVFCVLSDFSA